SVRKGRWLEGLGKLLSLRFNLLRSRPIQELRGILRKLVAEHRRLPARLRKLRLSGLRSLRKLLLIRHLCLSELLQLRVRGRKSFLRAAHLPAKVLHQTRSTLLIKLPIPLRSLALRGNLGSRNTLTRSRSGRSRVTLTRSRSVRNTRIGDTRHLFLLGIAAQHLPHRKEQPVSQPTDYELGPRLRNLAADPLNYLTPTVRQTIRTATRTATRRRNRRPPTTKHRHHRTRTPVVIPPQLTRRSGRLVNRPPRSEHPAEVTRVRVRDTRPPPRRRVTHHRLARSLPTRVQGVPHSGTAHRPADTRGKLRIITATTHRLSHTRTRIDHRTHHGIRRERNGRNVRSLSGRTLNLP